MKKRKMTLKMKGMKIIMITTKAIAMIMIERKNKRPRQ